MWSSSLLGLSGLDQAEKGGLSQGSWNDPSATSFFTEMAECHISEDSQIVSFDGHSHPIQDTCTYIMVKVCHPNMNLPFFTISAKTSRDTHNKIKTFSVYQLYIDIFNFRVILQRDHLVLVSWGQWLGRRKEPGRRGLWFHPFTVLSSSSDQ